MHRIDENKSNSPDGPANKNRPENPINTPNSFSIENSSLYREKRIKAVRIGTVACSTDKDPAPKLTDANANKVKGNAVFSNPINKNENPWSKKEYFLNLKIKKGAINIAAKAMRNETICNGSKPSSTNSLKNKNEPPQKNETSNNVKKSFVFMIKKSL